jgi:hypothetical protein
MEVSVHVRAKAMRVSSLFPTTAATSTSRPERESDSIIHRENIALFSLATLHKNLLHRMYKEIF